MLSENISIDTLDNHQKYTYEVVNMVWNEWSSDYKELTPYKTPGLLYDFYAQTSCSNIPTAFIIFNSNTHSLIGTALVDTEDMGVHPECTPWLSSVCIKPEYRNKGYASILVKYIISKYPTLHLWTFNERLAKFYSRFGFETQEIIPKHGNHDNLIYMIYHAP